MTDEEVAAVKQAVAAGIREVLADEEQLATFWGAAFKALQAQAQVQTGRFLLGSIGALAKRIGLFVALGLIVYSLGGWTAVSKLWHALVVAP
jgi:hypothetical protein